MLWKPNVWKVKLTETARTVNANRFPNAFWKTELASYFVLSFPGKLTIIAKICSLKFQDLFLRLFNFSLQILKNF